MPAAKAATGPHGRKMQPKPGRMSENKPAIDEVHILWITAGSAVTATRSRSRRLPSPVSKM